MDRLIRPRHTSSSPVDSVPAALSAVSAPAPFVTHRKRDHDPDAPETPAIDVRNLQEFFRTPCTTRSRASTSAVDDHTEHYVVSLLTCSRAPSAVRADPRGAAPQAAGADVAEARRAVHRAAQPDAAAPRRRLAVRGGFPLARFRPPAGGCDYQSRWWSRLRHARRHLRSGAPPRVGGRCSRSLPRSSTAS